MMKQIFLFSVYLLWGLSASAQVYNFKWAKSVGAPAFETIAAMTVDADGNVYTTGHYGFTVDFDPGPGVFNLTATPGVADVFIQKLDSNGNFVWAKSISGNSDTHGTSIGVDSTGNVYVSGYYIFTADFDPGPGVHNLTTVAGKDVFILKLNASGNFVWVKSVGGGNMEENFGIAVDAAGNTYTTGFFAGLADFDPGPGVHNLLGSSFEDLFTVKLNSNGDFVWANSIGGTSHGYGSSVALDASGNIYKTGHFTSTVDFDPGLGTSNLTSNGGDDIFIQKQDTAGNFVWTKSLGGTADDKGHFISVDASGHTYVTGVFEGTVDFDPGPGTFNLTSSGAEDLFVLKLDGSGNFMWATQTGGSAVDEGNSIAVDDSSYAYVTGSYTGTVDFDPGSSAFDLTSTTDGQIFVQKLAPNGNFVWATAVGGTGRDEGLSIATDNARNLILAGTFDGTEDFDPTVNVFNLVGSGNDDFFIQKLGQNVCAIYGIAIDSVLDMNCGANDSGYIYVNAQHGTPPYVYSWNVASSGPDTVGTFGMPGIYTVTATDVNNCAASASVLLNGPSSKTGFDLNVNLVAGNFRTGFPATIWLDAFNSMCDATSGQLMIVLDSLVTYDSSSVVPDQINGDTLVWNFSNLTYDSAHIMRQVFLTTDTSAGIGDTVCFEAIVVPISGDADTTNNVKKYCFDVINAYDPNDKQVYPQGKCEEKYVLIDAPLTYKIRFQNTGNADAINVHIIDSIRSDLDITTVNVIGASHEMYTEVLDGNVLDFRFDNIHLPDSNTNEALSHGFVIFEISPKSGLGNGTIVENTSEIYFDFNPAVVTNTVSNTLVDEIPSCFTSLEEFTNIDGINIYPNPVLNTLTIANIRDEITAIWIVDISGKTYSSKSANNTVDVSQLSAGIYFITIITAKRVVTKKFIKN